MQTYRVRSIVVSKRKLGFEVWVGKVYEVGTGRTLFTCQHWSEAKATTDVMQWIARNLA